MAPGGHAAAAVSGGLDGFGAGAMAAAPDDADEEGAEGGEAGADDRDGGFGGGPDGGGDVVPWMHVLGTGRIMGVVAGSYR